MQSQVDVCCVYGGRTQVTDDGGNGLRLRFANRVSTGRGTESHHVLGRIGQGRLGVPNVQDSAACDGCQAETGGRG